jgi:cysteinyl-tRNA synthetase
MAEFFGLARALNKATGPEERQKLAATMYATGDLLGLLLSNPDDWFAGGDDGELSADAINEMIEKRNAARAAKDFAAADGLRDKLAEAGIQIEDGPNGTTWRRT